jgi:hypothetical protein
MKDAKGNCLVMVKQGMNGMLRRGDLPFVRRHSSFVVVVVRSATLMSVGKIKGRKKKRRSKRIGLTEK